MTSPGTLPDLKVHFEQSIQDNALVLTAANGVVPALVTFAGGLPDGQLRLPAPDIQLGAAGLTVTATCDEHWPTGGTGTRALHVTWIQLTITQPGDFAVEIGLTGAVTVGGTDIPVNGAVTGNVVAVGLPEGSSWSLPLAAIADFVSDNKLGNYLPPGVPIFDSVPLSALRLSFGYGPDAVTELEASSTLAADVTWPVVKTLADLKNLGVTLTSSMRYQHGNHVEQIGGDIHATLHLEQDFTVRLVLSGLAAWALEILPADGNFLPGLATLAGLAGAAIPKQLQELSIDGVRIVFDLATRALQQIIVAGHLTVDAITFDVTVSLPDFEFHGGLSPTSPIHLKALIGTYFPGAEQFPEIDITGLDIAAIPSIGQYSLDAGITGDWKLDVGPVPIGFQQFNFEIAKDPEGVTGYIEGVFSLFDAGFDVIAEHPEAGGGWQFTAQSVPGQPLTIKAIHDRVVQQFSVDSTLPAAIEGLVLDNLRVWFNTATGNFSFTCEAKFPIDDKEVDITVTIRLEKVGDAYQKTFGGHVTVGGLVFDLKFVQDKASTAFAAVYSHTGEQQPVTIRDLVAEVSSAAAQLVPGDLKIDLRDVLFVFSKGTSAGFVFGLDLGVEFGLSQLPLVGKEFPPERKVGIDSLRLLVASREFTVGEIGAVNALLPAAVPPLPDVSKDARQGQPPVTPDTVALTKGITVTARLLLGGDAAPQTLSLPAGGGSDGAAPVQSASGPAVVASDDARWFDVQRAFGPVYFERVGFEYRDKVVRFLLDGALTVAGLTLSLDGLALGSAIDNFAPSFDLRGLGLDYRSGPVEIGGALLRTRVTPASGPPYDEYDGAALIRTEKLSLAALGSYAYLDGQPSLFVYAVLDAALGGPPFFFVTGLAAGFGYNRTIVVPPVDKVADFPLITTAASPQPITGAADPGTLIRSTVDSLRTAIPPAAGSVFLAIGVKFVSFRIIDSFALLVATFGDRFELDVLGLSTVVAPTPEAGQSVTPLAEIQLALKAAFIPDEGFLGVSAQLTAASFLFSRACHLTGGFAFYSWFSGVHAGDFVLSVGGYHPQFRKPDNYPAVQRLGVNWQVDSQLVIKGDAYYALTPVALMAGGHLEAVWQSGNLRAAFTAGADFIVAWKPYHYDAHAYVDINVSYTFEFFGTHHIDVDLGADVHIWGPEFAGTAHISLSIISFDVTFGDQRQPTPKPIGWSTFRDSFLPAADRCGVAVSAGLLRKGNDSRTDLGVIDPQRLVLLTNTVIPSTAARIRGALAIDRLYYTGDAASPVFVPFAAPDRTSTPTQNPTAAAKPAGAVAVGPMGIVLPSNNKGPHLRSTLTLTITSGTDPMEHHFTFTPVLKSLPAGMWGELPADLRPDPNAAPLVPDTLVGFEIRPQLDPIEGTDQAKAVGLELRQYHLPALPAGTYHLAITQEVTTDEPAATTRLPLQKFSSTGDFVVAGTRAAFTAEEIYAVYPPDGALGDYAADLPHVILKHSTLPWQESADPNRHDLPWLALLLFEEADAPAPHVVTAGQLRNPATLPEPLRGAVFPTANLGDGQPDLDKITVIDVPAARLLALLPVQDAKRQDLALLAHVRLDAGTERAVIVGNRQPRAGATHVAHLVSVRNRYGATGFDLGGASGDTPVRLISLTSWRFASTGSRHDASGLLRRIATRGGPLRLPAGADEELLAHGYLPMRHTSRTGERTPAWYHGPLVPQANQDRPTLPAAAAEDLMPRDGLADLSYPAAWALGRLLALRSKPFATTLYRWKRARARQRKQDDQGTPPVPAPLSSWLNDLALLRGVPFNYLVPAEEMLPAESLRFFSLHTGWTAGLLDGALSIGRATPSDVDLDGTLAVDLRAAAGSTLSAWVRHLLDPTEKTMSPSGFLLRSDAVAGWPDLTITATTATGPAGKPQRSDQLSANTQLCLFAEEITAVTIKQNEQTLHFELDPAPGPGTVDITALATDRIGAAAAARAASASLAAQLLAKPPEVTIPR